jgi:hypothetical protein
MSGPAAILDVDGTLVDSNYQHTIAWYCALRQHGQTLAIWRIHRHIGMGGDQLVAALCGDEVEAELGDDIRSAASPIRSRGPAGGRRGRSSPAARGRRGRGLPLHRGHAPALVRHSARVGRMP